LLSLSNGVTAPAGKFAQHPYFVLHTGIVKGKVYLGGIAGQYGKYPGNRASGCHYLHQFSGEPYLMYCAGAIVYGKVQGSTDARLHHIGSLNEDSVLVVHACGIYFYKLHG
jgi:hypothetical protein